MVKLQSGDAYLLNTLQSLKNFTKDGCLCDIDIIVGDNRQSAHKCILAAGSDYFKACFCGPLKQDDSEVNLTTVTDDFESVVSVLDFLYTGDINVDDENLAIILKLASFLLIEMLRGMCIHYMETGVNLDNCLQYFLLAAEFGVSELERTLSNTIASRFHDCLIFRVTTLNVSPSQMKFLMESCKVFEFCTGNDMMSFMIDWIAEGNTAEYEQVGCEVLNIAKQKADLINCTPDLKHKFDGFKEKMQRKLEGNNKCLQFVTKINDIIIEISTEVEGRIELMPNPELKHHEVAESDTENVLIAFAPNKHLIYFAENSLRSPNKYAIRNGQALFDICIYVPRKKTWYHLSEGYREKAFKKVPNQATDEVWDRIYNCLMYDKICFLSEDDAVLFLYDLKSLTWKEMNYNDPTTELEDGEIDSSDMYFLSSDDKLYLFLKYSDSKTDTSGFCCYIHASDNSWRHLFSIPIIDVEFLYFRLIESEFSAAISKSSHEMILVCRKVKKLHVFAVDMDMVESSETNVRHVKVDDAGFVGWNNPFYILEYGEFFAIFEKYRTFQNQYVFHCVCRYKLQTARLIPENDKELIDCFFQRRKIDFSNLPCEYMNLISDNRHIWMFEGNGHDGSSLKSVSVDEKGSMTVQTHVPPPFSCVSGMVAGEIKSECLTGLKPIAKYLHEEVRDFNPSEREYSPSD